MRKLVVAVPTSTIVNEPGLLLKTLKIYQFIRYVSIFGVDELVFYNDGYIVTARHEEASRIIEKVWRYLLTPPYLRRKIIPLDKDLRYVGLLPPLRLEVFDVSQEPRSGEKRLGLVIKRGNRILVDAGLHKPLRLERPCGRVGDIILVEITDPETGIAVCIDDDTYRGPILGFEDSFTGLLKAYPSTSYTLIATSRHGRVPAQEELIELSQHSGILIIFGSPKHGLYEIARKAGIKLREAVKYIWNTIPCQRVRTIRTEEAVLITLGIVNMFLRRS